jgi:hypothetical protein
MNAIVFLYKRVLNYPMEGRINDMHTDKNINVPVVMTREEVAAILSLVNGTAELVGELLYGRRSRCVTFLLVCLMGHEISCTPHWAFRQSPARGSARLDHGTRSREVEGRPTSWSRETL